MANNTYVALDKKTTLSDVSSVEFTSIPQGYTDLVIVANVRYTATNIGQGIGIRFNNDSSANYTATVFEGDGSSGSSYRQTGGTQGIISAPANGSQTGFSPFIVSVMNYSNATTMKPWVSRNSGPTYVNGYAGLWRATPQAITSMQFIPSASAGNIATGSTFSLYGILAEAIRPTVKASGGTFYSDSTYYYHVFGTSGTFTPTESITADVLVVAGGGGGGGYTFVSSGGSGGAGGGAGGLLAFNSQSLTATNYTVTVGSGGNGGSGVTGSNGSDSQFAALTLVKGGGGGAGNKSTGTAASGLTGGSGGGAVAWDYNGTTAGGAATSEQGNAGGSVTGAGGSRGGGGGGGAGAAGTTRSLSAGTGGQGGVGSSSYSSWGLATGTGEYFNGTFYYAGGGAGNGGGDTVVLGGYGGGATHRYNVTPAQAGQPNTGGGGAGGLYDSGANAVGGKGGSGVVIVRYAK
jgi:hypothetical protein